MLTVHEALERVLVAVPELPAEPVPVAEALGRVLADDVIATLDVPPWDNSAMDGYALRAADTGPEPVELELLEVIGAGAVPTERVEPGTASGIMTGAPVPEGADAVVMVEHTDGSQQGTVTIDEHATEGQNIRPRGNDIRRGDVILRAGQRLTPAALGHAASQGRTHLPVVQRPVIAVLSTGDEVVPPGQPLEPGQIHSSNNASLSGLVEQAGGEAVDLGTVPDDLDAIVAALRDAIDRSDAVLTSGGVSVGEFDYVKQAFDVIGVPMGFWKVRMKPGKPLAFGVAEAGGRRVPVFGLPGNPVSCMVNFLQYVRPWMLLATGVERPYLPVVEAVAAERLRKRPGRLDFQRVVLELDGGTLRARSTGNQSSGVLTSMVRGHGLAMLESDSDGAREGDTIRVQLFDASFLDRTDPGWP